MPNGKKRIYVADDDDNIRQVIKTFLMGNDYITKPFFVPAEICEEMGEAWRNMEKRCRYFKNSGGPLFFS